MGSDELLRQTETYLESLVAVENGYRLIELAAEERDLLEFDELLPDLYAWALVADRVGLARAHPSGLPELENLRIRLKGALPALELRAARIGERYNDYPISSNYSPNALFHRALIDLRSWGRSGVRRQAALEHLPEYARSQAEYARTVTAEGMVELRTLIEQQPTLFNVNNRIAGRVLADLVDDWTRFRHMDFRSWRAAFGAYEIYRLRSGYLPELRESDYGFLLRELSPLIYQLRYQPSHSVTWEDIERELDRHKNAMDQHETVVLLFELAARMSERGEDEFCEGLLRVIETTTFWQSLEAVDRFSFILEVARWLEGQGLPLVGRDLEQLKQSRRYFLDFVQSTRGFGEQRVRPDLVQSTIHRLIGQLMTEERALMAERRSWEATVGKSPTGAEAQGTIERSVGLSQAEHRLRALWEVIEDRPDLLKHELVRDRLQHAYVAWLADLRTQERFDITVDPADLLRACAGGQGSHWWTLRWGIWGSLDTEAQARCETACLASMTGVDDEPARQLRRKHIVAFKDALQVKEATNGLRERAAAATASLAGVESSDADVWRIELEASLPEAVVASGIGIIRESSLRPVTRSLLALTRRHSQRVGPLGAIAIEQRRAILEHWALILRDPSVVPSRPSLAVAARALGVSKSDLARAELRATTGSAIDHAWELRQRHCPLDQLIELERQLADPMKSLMHRWRRRQHLREVRLRAERRLTLAESSELMLLAGQFSEYDRVRSQVRRHAGLALESLAGLDDGTEEESTEAGRWRAELGRRFPQLREAYLRSLAGVWTPEAWRERLRILDDPFEDLRDYIRAAPVPIVLRTAGYRRSPQ